MNSDEMRAFLQTIAEKMKPDFNMDDAYKNLAGTLQVFAEAADKMQNNIDWDSLRCSLQTFADILARIPDEVKNTGFFHKVDRFAKYKEYDLTYENIEWFLEDIRNEVLIEGTGSIAGTDDTVKADNNTETAGFKPQTNLTRYIYRIKDDPSVLYR